jgi:membrane-bound inhibitor of C-type lysozyme
MKIQFNKVTWYSKLAAVILFVLTFILAFHLGKQFGSIGNDHVLNMKWGNNSMMNNQGNNKFGMMYSEKINAIPTQTNTIKSVSFSCSNNKTIQAIFRGDFAYLTLSDGRAMNLFQTISASGARYANTDESFVFWNKGNSATISEGLGKSAKVTFADCTTQ